MPNSLKLFGTGGGEGEGGGVGGTHSLHVLLVPLPM